MRYSMNHGAYGCPVCDQQYTTGARGMRGGGIQGQYIIFGVCGTCAKDWSIADVRDDVKAMRVMIECRNDTTQPPTFKVVHASYADEGIKPKQSSFNGLAAGKVYKSLYGKELPGTDNTSTDTKLVDLVKRLLVNFYDPGNVPNGMDVTIQVDVEVLRKLKEEVQS